MSTSIKEPKKPRLITLPRNYDPRGSLTFVQNGNADLGFDIERVYWIYDVPAGESRGSHSHIEGEIFVLAISGCLSITLTDGFTEETYTLNRPFTGLYIPPGYWHTLQDFTTGTVALVLASSPYSEADYIRDYDTFLKSVHSDGGACK